MLCPTVGPGSPQTEWGHGDSGHRCNMSVGGPWRQPCLPPPAVHSGGMCSENKPASLCADAKRQCSPDWAALRPREPTLGSPTLMRAAGAPGREEPGQLAADNSKLLPLSLVRGSFLKTKFLIKCLLQLKCYFVKIFIPLCEMLDSHGCSWSFLL